MLNLSTKYAGMSLKNPLVVGSSGLTGSVDKNKELEKAGVGAIVLKSLFEEQIAAISDNMMSGSDYPEVIESIRCHVKKNQLNDYLALIRESKAVCTIPVIASINCYTADSWVEFASQIEKAGADAIELNVFSISMSLQKQPPLEKKYVEILKKVKARTNIPVIVKIGKYHDNIPYLVQQLYNNGAHAAVLFNKLYQSTIDVHNLSLVSGQELSDREALPDTLRWIGIVSGMLPQIELSASTGAFDWEDTAKCILAGASTVQLCSAVYQYGTGVFSEIIDEMKAWMESMNFRSLADFRGKLNYGQLPDPAFYERVQFIKSFSETDE